jgi:hypothetical protein
LKDPDYWDGGEAYSELEKAKLKTDVEGSDGSRRNVLPEFVRARLQGEGEGDKGNEEQAGVGEENYDKDRYLYSDSSVDGAHAGRQTSSNTQRRYHLIYSQPQNHPIFTCIPQASIQNVILGTRRTSQTYIAFM